MIERVFELLLFGCILLTARCCITDSDCNTGQCCNNYHGPMIVSKRESSFLQQLQPLTGVCENYKLLNDHCFPLDKMNGHCSCGPGLSCQFVPASTATSANRMVIYPGPGDYKCI